MQPQPQRPHASNPTPRQTGRLMQYVSIHRACLRAGRRESEDKVHAFRPLLGLGLSAEHILVSENDSEGKETQHKGRGKWNREKRRNAAHARRGKMRDHEKEKIEDKEERRRKQGTHEKIKHMNVDKEKQGKRRWRREDADLVEARISAAHAAWESNGNLEGRTGAVNAVSLPGLERVVCRSSATSEGTRADGRTTRRIDAAAAMRVELLRLGAAATRTRTWTEHQYRTERKVLNEVAFVLGLGVWKVGCLTRHTNEPIDQQNKTSRDEAERQETSEQAASASSAQSGMKGRVERCMMCIASHELTFETISLSARESQHHSTKRQPETSQLNFQRLQTIVPNVIFAVNAIIWRHSIAVTLWSGVISDRIRAQYYVVKGDRFDISKTSATPRHLLHLDPAVPRRGGPRLYLRRALLYFHRYLAFARHVTSKSASLSGNAQAPSALTSSRYLRLMGMVLADCSDAVHAGGDAVPDIQGVVNGASRWRAPLRVRKGSDDGVSRGGGGGEGRARCGADIEEGEEGKGGAASRFCAAVPEFQNGVDDQNGRRGREQGKEHNVLEA
ncbi:hypothetical protein C8R45DRAFT_1136791 [Mycena sanguinolenta]|nr:hypothetical protein C8R45DRAFT_1136791 [Mycena sanguinolenta]